MASRELTARQIKFFDEMGVDKRTLEDTLNVALNFHANQLNAIHKKEKEFWKELTDIHGLDTNKRWMTKNIDGVVQIVACADEEY